MYFRLNPECYFIKGKKHGSIFDLINGEIYSLNQRETDILASCEKNNPISKNIDFLNELKQLCLGNFYPNKPYIQKLRVGSPIPKDERIKPPEFSRAFLEINNNCNRDCWFCGFYGTKRSLGCIGCNKWDENDDCLPLERWIEIIDELKDLNCQEIFIKGGDLTLEWDKTLDILKHADGKFTSVNIVLHHKSLSEDIIKEIENNTNLIIQIENIDSIQYEEFMHLLIVKPENRVENYLIEHKNILTDFVIEEDITLSNILPMLPKKEFPPFNTYQFINNQEYHPCLGHTLAIGYNGNVIPCPMMRHSILGNLVDNTLHTIFEEKFAEIDKFWKLNLDEIEKCTSCEFKYACTDCRALEECLTGKLNGKSLCSYNPEEGEWL